jgi:hypothetical protein
MTAEEEGSDVPLKFGMFFFFIISSDRMGKTINSADVRGVLSRIVDFKVTLAVKIVRSDS